MKVSWKYRKTEEILKSKALPAEEYEGVVNPDNHDAQWLVFIASTYGKCLGIGGGIWINTHFSALVLIGTDC